jgi:integrase
MATFTKLPSGHWRAQIRRAGHRPIGKVFEKKSEARAWAEKLEGNRDAIDAFPDAEARRRTVKDAIDGYMLDHSGSDSGIVGRLSWWRTEYGGTALANFTQPRVREGLRKLARENVRHGNGRGKNRGKSKALDRKKSGSTVTRYQAALSSAMRWAVDQGWITRNPVLGIRRPKPPPGRVRYLADDERQALFEAADASLWTELGLLVRLALSTGARLGELMALEWADIDLKNGLAYVRRTKNDDPRVLPLIAPVRQRIEKMARPINGGLLFPSSRKASKPYAMRKAWDAAVTAAKLENFRFHDLRHSCASYLAMNGATPLEIGDVLGHKTLAMVRRYSHLSTEHKKKLAERVLGGMVE